VKNNALDLKGGSNNGKKDGRMKERMAITDNI